MTSSAVLNGSGNPNAEATTGWFRYATTSPGTCNDTFGTRVPATSGTGLGTGTTSVAYSITTTGLTPGTLYYFCAVTSNASGIAVGAVLSFTTPAAPVVVTGAATSINSSSATLNGSANPTAAATTGWFRFSTTNPGSCSDSFGTRLPATSGGTALGSGTAAVGYNLSTSSVTSLAPGTTYYYCAIASNALGTSFGAVMSFATLPNAPSVATGTVTALTATSATLNGSANPGGGATTAWFRYSATNPGGCSDTFGTRIPGTGGSSLGAGGSSVSFSQSIAGLTMGQTYYVCAIASNSAGTTFGGLGSFVTPTLPSVTTNNPSTIADTNATLSGSANPRGASTTGWFRYSTTNPTSCDDSFGTRVPSAGGTDLGAGGGAVSFGLSAIDLLPTTTYYTCAIASNAIGTSFGAVVSFTTRNRPTVTTAAASSIASTSTQLNGSANPNGASASGWFRIATTDPGSCTDTFGTRIPSGSSFSLGSGTAAVGFATNTNTTISLTPGTTYYYCALASNTFGTSVGTVASFTTLPAVPSVSTSSASGVTAAVATLNGTANPGGGATTAWFRYATSSPGTCNDTFGTRAPATGGSSLGAGNSTVSFSQGIAGLSQGTTYYYCAVAQNAAGTSFGGVVSFLTPNAPTVTTGTASSVTNVQAQLNGTANPNQAAATGWFRLSTTSPGTCNDTFGTRVPTVGDVTLGAGASATSFSQPASGLAPNTTYYVCAIASNALGTSVGTVTSFTTFDQPAVTTSAASSVASTTAQLNGSGNPNGATATGWFRVATTNPTTCNDTFGTRVPSSSGANLGTGRSAVGFAFSTSSTISLTPGTTYYYCALGSNAYGTAFGTVQSFTTTAVQPQISTSSVTLLTSTTATINGSGNPGGASTTAWFRYSNANPGSCNDTFGTRVPATGGTDLGAGNSSVAFLQALTGLTQNTTYYYCAIGSNGVGTVFGGLASFTTPGPPSVVTNAATGLGDTTVTLNGAANPHGDATTGWFRYGTTNPTSCDDTFGTRVPAASGGTNLGAGSSLSTFNIQATGLTPNTTYYYCALAANSLGTVFGTVLSFTTTTAASVTTLAATALAATSATLNGSGNPNGTTTGGWFRLYTTDPGTCSDVGGTRIPSGSNVALGGGTAPVAFTSSTSTTITLTPGTTYYYCAIASNSFGTSFGAVVPFTTLAAIPTVSTDGATSVTATTATLTGSANPRGGTTTGWFRYSATSPGSCNDTFGTRVPATGGTDLGAGNTGLPFTQALTGLTPGTTYYYCAIASNSAGTAYGGLTSFVTPTAPTVVTNAATGINDTSVTLNGSGNPNRAATLGWFRYSTTNPVTCDDMFGTRVPASSGTDLGAGSAAIGFNQVVNGLSPTTPYYYCAIASNALGTSFGTVQSFTTRNKPSVTTLAATTVTSSAATLNGSANPNGASTSGWVRVGNVDPGTCNDTFGTRIPSGSSTGLGSGTTAVGYRSPPAPPSR